MSYIVGFGGSGTQNITHILKAFTEYVINHFTMLCSESKKDNCDLEIWSDVGHEYGREETFVKDRERSCLKRDHRMDKPRGRICDGSPSVGWDIYSVVVKEKRWYVW